jgi:hypothetical protein
MSRNAVSTSELTNYNLAFYLLNCALLKEETKKNAADESGHNKM